MNKVKVFISEQLKSFNDAEFIRLLKIFTGAVLVIILYAAVYSGFQIVDEFEHLHASWLVSTGKVPYRDFFEHHHPLLWYMSAPIVALFYDHAIIFYVMRAISVLASLLTLLYIYKITLFFGNKNCAWFAIVCFFSNIVTLLCFYQYRPDTFMNLFFIIGLYYWFVSLKEDSLKHLTYSFLSFAVSVLFLQKISLLLLVVEAILLGLICFKKMKLKTITLAAIPPLVLFLCFFFILYMNHSLFAYIELNYHFNQALVHYFDRGSFWYPSIWFTVYPIALFTVIFFYKKENIYFKIVALLFIAEFLMRGFYFAPHPNYYTLLAMFSAMILSVYGKKLMPKHKFLAILVILLLFLNMGRLFKRLSSSIDNFNSYKHYQLVDYVHKNSTADDLLMNGYDKIFNIYRYDVSYYWFGLDMLLPVMELEYELEQKPDINVMVFQYHPKFIYVKNYVDLRAMRSYGEIRYTQQFMPELLQALYKPTPFENLAVLK